MVTLLSVCMPEACPCFVQTSHTYNLCFGTKRGSTVVYACSQVHTLRKARMYKIHGDPMDCLNPYFAHSTIHGLRAQITDYCANYGSIDCAEQSTDCPDP